MATIQDVLSKEEFDNIRFTKDKIDWLNKRIAVRKDGKLGVECIVRGLNSEGELFELKPEEVIRQLYAYELIEDYGYDKEQLEFEVPVIFAGRATYKDKKRIDILVHNKDDNKKIDLIIEVKRPSVNDESRAESSESTTPFQQMFSYCSQKHPTIGVIVNGANLEKFYYEPKYDTALALNKFPQNGEDLQDWKNGQRFTIKQLYIEDRLQYKTLKDIILSVEQRFGANDSSDKAFNEIFKLIFIKLYDEKQSSRDADLIAYAKNAYKTSLKDVDDSCFRVLQFRVNPKDSDKEVIDKFNSLFDDAKRVWPGVFEKDAVLNMQAITIRSCVKELENVKLFNSNLEVIDDAFEHLVNLNQKGNLGQFFTPRYVIDMCVKMLNPKPNEYMIDTAAGSCGFPMHTVFHVWEKLNPTAPNLFTTKERTDEEKAYVRDKVFGIDYSENSVRVGRMLNIIAGDGHTNVIELNTLDYPNWTQNYINRLDWKNKYGEGFERFVELSCNPRSKSDSEKFKKFKFDVLMANPPFAGEVDESRLLKHYELSKNAKGKVQNKVVRDILFIERNLDFLKPGGRMAIVLPQGRFNNSTDINVRKYIAERCRILAVISLHGNTFKNGKAGTGTKTSVLLVQKWTDENSYKEILDQKALKSCDKDVESKKYNICQKPSNGDYPIFFATMKEEGKDNSGNKIYVTENYVTWKKYKYYPHKVYLKRTDWHEVSEDEYLKAKSKKEYVVNTNLGTQEETILTESGKKDFIKDEFIKQFGEIESHQKWILKNVDYVLKEDDPTHIKVINMLEYVRLSADEKKLYKKEEVFGENNRSVIDNAEYHSLTADEKKCFLKAEEIIEHTERVKDMHGHYFVKHDLFNHDPLLENKNPNNVYSQNGIAEAFAKFAYDNKLSFAPSKEELQKILHPENELSF